jgi:hypothetical protein
MLRIGRAALVLVVWGPLVVAAQELPRIVDIRVGEHPGYDRLVLELSAEAPAARGFDGADLVLRVGARPLLDRQLLSTGLERMGPLEIAVSPGGAGVRAEATTRRVRAFRLASPPRIVVDFGDPGDEPFELEEGLVPLPELALYGAPAVEPEPAPREVESAVPGPEAAEEEPPPLETPVVQEELAAEGAVAIEEPEGEEPLAADEALAAEEPPPEAELAEPEVPGAPEPAPEPTTPMRPAWEAPRAPAPSEQPGASSRLEVALWFAVPFLLAAAAIWILGSRRDRRLIGTGAESGGVRSPETISSQEILEATERIDLLEKRIDEEVRSRMQLEERATRLQEDLKVVHDRIQRLAQRGSAVG